MRQVIPDQLWVGSVIDVAKACAAIAPHAALAQDAPLGIGLILPSPLGDVGWSHALAAGLEPVTAAYGDKVRTTMHLNKLGKSTLHWDCKAVQAQTGETICEGRAIRIHAQIQEDGNLKSKPIPAYIRKALTESGGLIRLPEDEE